VARAQNLDLAEAKAIQQRTDRARSLFVKRLYRADPSDPKWYHLVLDTTVFSAEQSVTVLADAARAYFTTLGGPEPGLRS